MDKITVVCHKDHDKGYENYVGKCLLCEVESLEKRVKDLVNFRRATGEIQKWVGLTDEERIEANDECDGWLHMALIIEAKLKEKNGA